MDMDDITGDIYGRIFRVTSLDSISIELIEIDPEILDPVGRSKIEMALDLSSQPGFVPIGRITSLTPRVAEAYAHTTRKTLIRDIHDLIDKGVVEKSEEGVRAKREAILSFLPIRKMS